MELFNLFATDPPTYKAGGLSVYDPQIVLAVVQPKLF